MKTGANRMAEEQHRQTNSTPDTAATGSDWEKRVLCSDGNCIGVIGPDGRCKECGKPYEGELPAGVFRKDAEKASAQTAEPVADEPAAGQPDHSGDAAAFEDRSSPAAQAGDDDWEKRVLCSDGNCIGVIGPDGRCKECGKPYDPTAE
jgi:hypothetical protein